MSECTHDCSSCSSNCGERQQPHDFRKPCNAHSHIKKVFANVKLRGTWGEVQLSALLEQMLSPALSSSTLREPP